MSPLALLPLISTAFIDRAADLGLSIGTGAACWVDIDNDGWTDLVAGGKVWRNEKGKRFASVFDAGDSVAADFDNDGYADLFAWSQMKLYRNLSGKGFEEVALPEHPATVSRGACWSDLDGDGFVDLYVGGYEGAAGTYPDLVFMNRKGRSFEVSVREATNRARGVTACDFDRDGDVDIYVSNYRLQPNLLLMNDGKGGLTDEAADRRAVATSEGFKGGHSIGSCWGDFDNDGQFDLFAGNFAHVDSRGDQPKSRFLRNLGAKGRYRFEDLGTCGVFYQESYATPAAGDYDNDGLLDLFFTTVYLPASFGRPNHPVLFRNGGGFQFTDATKAAGVADLPPTYQAAWADFDRDGDLDLVTAGRLFVNQGTASNHWLQVRLKGDGRRVNRSAVGAQIRVRMEGKTLTRQVEAGTGEGNQNDLTLHFGLGAWSKPVDLEIVWPDGRKQQIRRSAIDRIREVSYRR